MAQIVSLTLYQNDEARPIIEAVVADNPGVRVVTMPGAVKLDCDDILIVKRASVEERLGHSWETQELQLVLISMAGYLDEDDDQFVLSWRH